MPLLLVLLLQSHYPCLGVEDTLTAVYDEDRQIKPRSKDEDEVDDAKKQEAYKILIDQLDGLPMDMDDDDVDDRTPGIDRIM